MVEPPPGIPTWWFVTALALAVLILGIAKSGFGGGIGILAVPLVANALRVEDALGVMLPLLLAADTVAFVQHRRNALFHYLRPTLAGATVGVGIGTVVLITFQRADVLSLALSAIVGSTCLFFCGLQAYRVRGGAFPRIADKAANSVIAGTLCGVVSTLSHSAGPILSIYLLEHRLEKRALVGTLVVFFYALNAIKLPTYVALGLLTQEGFLTALCFFPLVPLGAWLGWKMHQRVPEKPFTVILYAAAAIAGGRMLIAAF